MPDFLKNTLIWLVVIALMIALAAVPFLISLWLGFGWGSVITAALAVAVGWLAGQMGMEGATVAIPGWLALAFGLFAAFAWRLACAIVGVLS